MASFRYIDITADPFGGGPLDATSDGVATIIDDDANLDAADTSPPGQFNIGGTDYGNLAFDGEIYTGVANGQPIEFIYLTTGAGEHRIVLTSGDIDLSSGPVTIDPITGPVAFTSTPYEGLNGFVCFGSGTLIETAAGLVPVEHLRVGDAVQTRDNGMQAIRWVGKRHLGKADLARSPHLQPVCIPAGAFGEGVPERSLIVSPEHRVLQAGQTVSLLFGVTEVFVSANNLVRACRASVTAVPGVEYVHILFDRHEVVRSNGAWTESFHPDDHALGMIGDAQKTELFDIFPGLKRTGSKTNIAHARRILKRDEASLIYS